MLPAKDFDKNSILLNNAVIYVTIFAAVFFKFIAYFVSLRIQKPDLALNQP